MPKTLQSSFSKSLSVSRTPQSSFVQVPVKASGTNKSKTLLPRSAESLTSCILFDSTTSNRSLLEFSFRYRQTRNFGPGFENRPLALRVLGIIRRDDIEIPQVRPAESQAGHESRRDLHPPVERSIWFEAYDLARPHCRNEKPSLRVDREAVRPSLGHFRKNAPILDGPVWLHVIHPHRLCRRVSMVQMLAVRAEAEPVRHFDPLPKLRCGPVRVDAKQTTRYRLLVA